LKYQGGSDNWKVECQCGTQDDGEREWCLVTFVKCGSIHGIDDSETVPPLLICLFWML